MPSLKSLSKAYEVVELPYGNEKVTTHARVELIGSQSADGEKYAKLELTEIELRQQQRKLLAQIEGQIADVGEAFKVPPMERVLQFRAAMDETLNGLSEALTLARNEEDFAPLESTLLDGQTSLGEFGNELFKTPEEVDAQAKSTEDEIVKLRDQLQANAEDIHCNTAEQLALLISWWDVTESDEEGSGMQPITAEIFLLFPLTFRMKLLGEIKKKLMAQ